MLLYALFYILDEAKLLSNGTEMRRKNEVYLVLFKEIS
ncbi:hypothetical protein HMPREF9182_0059 [Streptococcus sp. oral taxon 056 str. F0418]|nr:hypothetical protein HMPREF9182_0059 [Streptococcus sp. oral taxon 056 str. F0418]